VPRVPYTDPGEQLPLNIFRTINHAPKLAKGYAGLGGRILARTDLDPKLRELVINAISVHLDCPYEWSHHGKWALDVGATPEELEALKAREYSRLGPRERACVEYALKVDANDVSDADVEALRAAGLDERTIVELTLTASFYGMTARFLNAMDVELDEGNPKDFAIPEQSGESAARRTIEERT
jgi:AhpD family alkylhydroperoxidase